MKLFLLSFTQGQYSDCSETFLGIYSSEEKRELAVDRYKKITRTYCGRTEKLFDENKDYGDFIRWEAELDKDCIEQT